MNLSQNVDFSGDWQQHCESEPLAFSNAIQPHGGLFAVDEAGLISHLSAQIQDFLPDLDSIALGNPLPAEFSAWLADLPSASGSRLEKQAFGLDWRLSRQQQTIIFECCPQQPESLPAGWIGLQPTILTHDIEVQALNQQIVTICRELTGFDRVMLYVFTENGDGEVLAEVRNPDVYGSYLGLRFPASDIPQVARALYLQNPWRLIPDTQAAAVSIFSHCPEPLDLSYADLRSVSPVHQAYLANMGVKASLSLPLVIANQLWGLIACHHAQPRNVSWQSLQKASHATRCYTASMSQWLGHARFRFLDSIKSDFLNFRQTFVDLVNPGSVMAEIGHQILDNLKACGLVMQDGQQYIRLGETLDRVLLDVLHAHLDRSYSQLFLCDHLSSIDSCFKGQTIAGAIGIKIDLPSHAQLHLWIFRKEQLQLVEWGGNPSKPVESSAGPLRISPRRSFDKWTEKRQGFCRPWSNQDRLFAMHFRQLLKDCYANRISFK